MELVYLLSSMLLSNFLTDYTEAEIDQYKTQTHWHRFHSPVIYSPQVIWTGTIYKTIIYRWRP